MEIPILFEDRWLIVCVKPVGVVSEDGGMTDFLSEHLGGGRVYCVHRLDQAVGGVMVYAKDGKTAARLSVAMAARGFRKEYLAAVSGCPEPEKGEMRDLLFHDAKKNKTFVADRKRAGVKEAALTYESLQTAEHENGRATLVRVVLETGRSHQIRAQFASRKMPLLGDGRYGSREKNANIALLSQRIEFLHPVTGKELRFEIPLPDAKPWNWFDRENI